MQISPSGNTFDLDVSFWLGNVDASFNLNGEAFSDLPSAGFGTRADNNWTPTNLNRDVAITSPVGGVNALLFGARVGGDSTFDRFKMSSLALTTVPIPEPSSAGMLAFGVVSLLIRRRR